MKGKIGLIVGLGAGYVLGTRAGRERYEQIRTQWLKVWNLDPVQEKVELVKDLVSEKAAAVPGAIWTGAVKVVQSIGGSGTPGQKLDSAIAKGKKAAGDVGDAVEDVVDGAKATVKSKSDKASDKPSSTPASTSSATQSAPKKTGA
jgi:hypothetical protein